MNEYGLAPATVCDSPALAVMPCAGDMIRVSRYLAGEHVYDHYGIYVDSGKVIHFARKSGRLFGEDPAIVHETTLERFLGGSTEYEVVRFPDKSARSPEEVVHTAYECVGETGYNVVFNNCEHFARYCKTGRKTSGQVIKISTSLAVGLITLLLPKTGSNKIYGNLKKIVVKCRLV